MLADNSRYRTESDEVQNVPGVPSQSVEPQEHKLVALSNELQDRREFVST
jgi:hypothetical protein